MYLKFAEATMIETAISLNGQDCTAGPGNTPQEYEAMAATFLRVAQAIRDKENGTIKCLSRDGRPLVSALVHNREIARNGKEPEFATIEELHCVEEPPHRAAEFRSLSSAMIDHFRSLGVNSR